jgi:hypothetical protein
MVSLVLGLLALAGVAGCAAGDASSNRGTGQGQTQDDLLASPGHPVTSPTGKYVLEVSPGPEDNGAKTWRVEIRDSSGATVYRDDADYTIRHTTYVLWADQGDQAWIYSGDVGVFYIEPDAAGRQWSKSTWRIGDPVDDVPSYLRQARPERFGIR